MLRLVFIEVELRFFHPVKDISSKGQSLRFKVAGLSAKVADFTVVASYSTYSYTYSLVVVRYPNLQVAISHALHVCSQNSFGLPRKLNGVNVQNAI